MPACSRCEKRGTKCLVAPGYSRCSECIKVGGRVKCDVHGPSEAEWRNLEKVEKELADEWVSTQMEQQRVQAEMLARLNELSTKLLRLDKQREMFRSRAAEMLRRGLKSIAELDAVEEKERLEKEKGESVANATSTLSLSGVEVSSENNPTPETSVFSEDSSWLWDPQVDRVLSDALSDFDPSHPFWASVHTDGDMPSTLPGS